MPLTCLRFWFCPFFHVPAWQPVFELVLTRRLAQDFMRASVHKGNDGPLWCVHGGETAVGAESDMVQRHVLRDIILVPGRPGHQPVLVEAAVFEKWDYAGHVFVSLEGLKRSILPQSRAMCAKWWQKKEPSLQTSIKKFQLGRWALRPSMPYGAEGERTADAHRCLPFATVSISLLVVMCIRSCHTSSRQKGRIDEDDVREALSETLSGILLHLPLERHGFYKLFGQLRREGVSAQGGEPCRWGLRCSFPV